MSTPSDLHEMPCEYCGHSFVRKFALDRFCSNSCANSSSFAMRKKPEAQTATCETCNKTFVIKKRTHGRYCSLTCANRGNSTPLEQRLWSRVDKSTPNGCWEWQGKRSQSGYGRIMYGNKETSVHRVVWELVNGPIADGVVICHQCDNPSCCNPDHLFEGTQQDNLLNMRSKQRHAFGSRHGQTKLTESDVVEIRRRHSAGEVSQQELAQEYRVAQYTIYAIVHRKTWAHIP